MYQNHKFSQNYSAYKCIIPKFSSIEILRRFLRRFYDFVSILEFNRGNAVFSSRGGICSFFFRFKYFGQKQAKIPTNPITPIEIIEIIRQKFLSPAELGSKTLTSRVQSPQISAVSQIVESLITFISDKTGS